MSNELGGRTGDRDIHDFRTRRSGSLGRTSSTGSSMRRSSFSLSGPAIHPQLDEDLESRIVSEAGDIGDRALSSRTHSRSSSARFSFDHVSEKGFGACIPEDILTSYEVSDVRPSPIEIISPLSTDGILVSEDKEQDGEKPWEQWWPLFEHISCLVHLAVFGILGVITRYLLQKLCGPGIINVTSDKSVLYLDLPSNMVGSFLMGWLGVVFKGDISKFSDLLAIGLTTGYLGSLTTFSGWNQAMLNLSVTGHWTFTALGFLISMLLSAQCIILGVHAAKGFRLILRRLKLVSVNGFCCWNSERKVDSHKFQLIVFVLLLMIWVFLVVLSGVLERKEFGNGGSEAQLWLACLVAPPGVWIRWWLSRLNGQGLGSRGLLKWVPFGTLMANVSAACIMAALATIKKEVNTHRSITVASGIQLGFLGCLSTVSTFIAEYRAMTLSSHSWRADVYASITIIVSFALGTLIYSVPVWVKG
ncbi:hypothetical protein Droror1_Dr00004965 [Drosera rotundifolia]